MRLFATISVTYRFDTAPVIEASGLQAAFDVHVFAFRQVVGKVLPRSLQYLVPVGFFFSFVGLAFLPAAAGSHAELCHGYSAWGDFRLGIFCEMAEHNYSVYTASHNLLLFL